MFHSSTSTGVPPREVTASTMASALCLCATSTSAFASDCTPVEVSACTNATRRAAGALDVFDHAPAEHPVPADDDLVPGRDQVDEAILHADRTGAGDGERKRVFGLKGVAQQRFQFLHH